MQLSSLFRSWNATRFAAGSAALTLAFQAAPVFAQAEAPAKPRRGQGGGKGRGAQARQAQAQPAPEALSPEQVEVAEPYPSPSSSVAGMTITLDSGSPIWVVQPGQETKLAFVFENPTNAAVRGEMSLSVESFDGSTLETKGTVEVPAGQTARWVVPRAALGEVGIKYLHPTLTVGGKSERLANWQIAYINPTGNDPKRQADGFKFGIAGIRWRPGQTQLLERQLQVAQAMGAEVWRDGLLWGPVQPAPDRWNWEETDKTLAMADKYGLEYQALLNGAPKWSLPDKYKDGEPGRRNGSYPAKPELWRQFVRGVATRYSDRVRFWEIWNEPDISFYSGTTAEYLEMLRIAHEEFKAANPNNQVMTGGFARATMRPAELERKGEILQTVLRDGQNYFDINAFHRHGPFPEFLADVDGPLAEARKALRSPKPLWFNETAMHSDVLGEREQARILFKKLSFGWARGAMGYDWFNLRERPNYPVGSVERTYGAVLADFQPKAVFVAYNAMAHLLKGKEFVRQLDLGEGRWGFLFGTPTEHVMTLWREDAAAADELWAVRVGPNASVAQVDIMGREQPVAVSNGIALLPITSECNYLVVRGGSEPQLTSRVLSPAVAQAANGSLNVALTNPFAQPLQLSLQNGEGTKLTRQLAGGAKETIAVPAAAVTGGAIRLRYALAGAQNPASQGELMVPLDAPLSIPNSDMARRAPDFTLNQAAQVVNIFEADPTKVNMLWRGPKDLSARAWLSLNEETMRVRVSTTDDIHRPTAVPYESSDHVVVTFKGKGPNQIYTFLLGLDAEGKAVSIAQRTPPGTPANLMIGATAIKSADGVDYELTLDRQALKLGANWSRQGIGFNLLLNDADGPERKALMQWQAGGAANQTEKRVVFQP